MFTSNHQNPDLQQAACAPALCRVGVVAHRPAVVGQLRQGAPLVAEEVREVLREASLYARDGLPQLVGVT